jgi:hypothetical protein
MNTVDWSQPTNNTAAARRAGGRTRINRERKAAAFWLGLEVQDLGSQGLLPLEIADRLKISAVTAYRHYWRHFGKRRPAITRRNAMIKQLVAEDERITRLFEPTPSQPVDRVKLSALLEKLRERMA